MDGMRGLLDDRNPAPEKEEELRRMLPRFHPRCGCVIPPNAGGSIGWHRPENHPEVAVVDAV
jgi:hypothetical protein